MSRPYLISNQVHSSYHQRFSLIMALQWCRFGRLLTPECTISPTPARFRKIPLLTRPQEQIFLRDLLDIATSKSPKYRPITLGALANSSSSRPCTLVPTGLRKRLALEIPSYITGHIFSRFFLSQIFYQNNTRCGHQVQPKNRLNQSTLATNCFTPSSHPVLSFSSVCSLP